MSRNRRARKSENPRKSIESDQVESAVAFARLSVAEEFDEAADKIEDLERQRYGRHDEVASVEGLQRKFAFAVLAACSLLILLAVFARGCGSVGLDDVEAKRTEPHP